MFDLTDDRASDPSYPVYGTTIYEGDLSEGMAFQTNVDLSAFDYFIVTLWSNVKCLGTFGTILYAGEEGANNLSFGTVTYSKVPYHEKLISWPIFVVGSFYQSGTTVMLDRCGFTGLPRGTHDIYQEFEMQPSRVKSLVGYRRTQ